MAEEEPRRSGRATKGQHTKERDILEDEMPKKKGKGAKKAASVEVEEEDDQNIRCICGLYDENEEGRAMIACDQCNAWQHNGCMGLEEDAEPKTYFCEQCKPGSHKKLLAAVARGEKPWLKEQEKWDAIMAERAAKKTKKVGKKGGRKSAARQSDVTEREVDSEQPEASPAIGQKRKHEDASNGVAQTEPKKSKPTPSQSDSPVATPTPARSATQPRKSSAKQTPSRQVSMSGPVDGMVFSSVNDLADPLRKSIAQNLVKFFAAEYDGAVKKGSFHLQAGESAETVATSLALTIESALFSSRFGKGPMSDPNEPYRNQARSMMFNLKRNEALLVEVLNRSILPHRLANMSADDMADEARIKADAALRREADKQATIEQAEAPKVRRTHKGDEYIDDSQSMPVQSAPPSVPIRQESTMKVEPSASSVTAPSFDHASTEKKMFIDSKRKSSAAILEKAWSSVPQGSPTNETQAQFPSQPQRQMSDSDAPPSGAQADADIDKLLKDEDVESPPYSPKPYESDPKIIWAGTVNGGPIGNFSATAEHLAGAKADEVGLTWSTLVTPSILIEGRIDPTKADAYLCGLQYSTTSELIILSIRSPETSSGDAEGFNKLFTYFRSRNRYGVGVQPGSSMIKDIYLIPAEAGAAKPEVLALLENSKLDGFTTVPENMLIVAFVLKRMDLPNSRDVTSPPQEPSLTAASPITAATGGSMPFEQQSGMQAPKQQSQPPYPPATSYGQQQPSQHQASHSPRSTYSSAPQPHLPGSNGTSSNAPHPGAPHTSAAAFYAEKLLGSQYANAPAVLRLIEQVPNAGESEMKVVQDILMQFPSAAQDLEELKNHLLAKSNRQQQDFDNQVQG